MAKAMFSFKCGSEKLTKILNFGFFWSSCLQVIVNLLFLYCLKDVTFNSISEIMSNVLGTFFRPANKFDIGDHLHYSCDCF